MTLTRVPTEYYIFTRNEMYVQNTNNIQTFYKIIFYCILYYLFSFIRSCVYIVLVYIVYYTFYYTYSIYS